MTSEMLQGLHTNTVIQMKRTMWELVGSLTLQIAIYPNSMHY